MEDRTCLVCEASMAGRAAYAKYCSSRCKSRASNAKRYKRPVRTCSGCGGDLTDRHGSVKYCSNACRRWVASGKSELRTMADRCRQCSGSIPNPRAGKVFCSKKCKMRAVQVNRVRDDHARYLRERERRIAYAIAYAAANPHVGQTAKRRRKALLAQAGVFAVTAKDWRRLKDRHGGRCAYCDVKAPLTMEHVVPISRGGTHGVGNLLPACANCNSSKRHRLLVEWRAGIRVSLVA
jgi:5-methylcytosine-specific restriction endonuclease McrA